MERWFESPAWEMPESWKKENTQPHPTALNTRNCDELIVRMDWATRFQSCREAIQVAESRIETPNAVHLLIKRLKTAGWVPGTLFDLGFHGMSAREMDAISQVNFVRFGESLDTLDDMYGALGKATLKVGVAGTAYSLVDAETGKPRHFFKVRYLGYYIRDNYDFNGPQYLGTWTADRVLTKAETIISLTPSEQSIVHIGTEPFAAINNPDFRRYRDKTGKGGDFVIYSDILWRKHEHIIKLGNVI